MNNERLDSMFNETRELRNRVANLEAENKELRDRLDKQEWFHREFKHEMLDRLAAADRH